MRKKQLVLSKSCANRLVERVVREAFPDFSAQIVAEKRNQTKTGKPHRATLTRDEEEEVIELVIQTLKQRYSAK